MTCQCVQPSAISVVIWFLAIFILSYVNGLYSHSGGQNLILADGHMVRQTGLSKVPYTTHMHIHMKSFKRGVFNMGNVQRNTGILIQ